MTDTQQREAARQFYYKWNGKGKEDEDARSYWIDILQNIFGVENVTDRVQFEKKVAGDKSKKRIDVYIPETHVLIEQKSLGIALDKPQAGHDNKTPYEQAKEYDNLLPYDEKARWIITSNFAEIWIYDMSVMRPEPVKLDLVDLQSHYNVLSFLIRKEEKKISLEMELSIQAGEIVGKIHDRFLEQYNDPLAKHTQRSLNVLCVRLVFCLYAEDAGLFGSTNAFHDYIAQYDPKDIRRALIDLFQVLDTPEDKRADLYLPDDLAAFPYVNGGLFSDTNIVIPKITPELKDVILESSFFDWSQISPTIFGAVFESTLNPETRRAGGMHYTSIENIHKVIDPLFLDDLKAEFEDIKTVKVQRTRRAKLEEFQNKLAGLTFLDPAAGSGNFLTESYTCLRKLENQIIWELNAGQMTFGALKNPIKMSIAQFYGIEINDFAVTVAKTALWIAECQMMQETEDIVQMQLDFLPLKTAAHIVEGNALRINWEDVVPKEQLNYIMGNPPFVGYSLQSKLQKEDILSLYIDEKGKPYKAAGKIDYVAGWYWKSADMMQGTSIRSALVSTNSITQGSQVADIWRPLFNQFGIHIDFGYRTFIWDSEASMKAHVHCVIIGFSIAPNTKPKFLFEKDSRTTAKNINAYLINGEDIFVEGRGKAICEAPDICNGFKAADNGFLILDQQEKDELLSKEPAAERWIRHYSMGVEFINNIPRYCLWLKDITPNELKGMPELKKRVSACREWRENATKTGDAYKLRETPHLFRPCKQFRDGTYIAIPLVSSSSRRYMPMGYVTDGMIPGNNLFCVFNASLYHFGVLTSNVHMAWIRAIGGFLKSGWRYSKDIVYNNFPWPKPLEEQKGVVERTARAIINARAEYPKSSLADLYNPDLMPLDLRKAHQANDIAVMQAYGMPIKETDEAACVAWLMRLYQEKIAEIDNDRE